MLSNGNELPTRQSFVPAADCQICPTNFTPETVLATIAQSDLKDWLKKSGINLSDEGINIILRSLVHNGRIEEDQIRQLKEFQTAFNFGEKRIFTLNLGATRVSGKENCSFFLTSPSNDPMIFLSRNEEHRDNDNITLKLSLNSINSTETSWKMASNLASLSGIWHLEAALESDYTVRIAQLSRNGVEDIYRADFGDGLFIDFKSNSPSLPDRSHFSLSPRTQKLIWVPCSIQLRGLSPEEETRIFSLFKSEDLSAITRSRLFDLMKEKVLGLGDIRSSDFENLRSLKEDYRMKVAWDRTIKFKPSDLFKRPDREYGGFFEEPDNEFGEESQFNLSKEDFLQLYGAWGRKELDEELFLNHPETGRGSPQSRVEIINNGSSHCLDVEFGEVELFVSNSYKEEASHVIYLSGEYDPSEKPIWGLSFNSGVNPESLWDRTNRIADLLGSNDFHSEFNSIAEAPLDLKGKVDVHIGRGEGSAVITCKATFQSC